VRAAVDAFLSLLLSTIPLPSSGYHYPLIGERLGELLLLLLSTSTEVLLLIAALLIIALLLFAQKAQVV
jgi:hypothetical protein